MSYVYKKTNWVEDPSVEYGATPFNNLESGVEEAHKRLDNLNVGDLASYNKMQTINMANATKKLRMGEVKTSFAFMGDSVFYAFSTRENDPNEPRVPETCIADDGTELAGFYRSTTTIYNTFGAAMKKVYGSDKIEIVNKTFTGVDAYRVSDMYRASGCDFALINYGINDAVGGHTDGAVGFPYMGKVDLYIKEMREIIETQIKGGTAVVLMSPVKQTMLGADNGETPGTDTDSRVLIDVYEQACRNLALEYDCAFIDGNELVKGFDNKKYIDFTHFTKEGFRSIGQRLASYFIGQSPLEPLKISSNCYLGVNTQLDNVNLVGNAILDSSDRSPNPPMALSSPDLYGPDITRLTGGLYVGVQGFGKVLWSFYTEQDGMVVVPCFYTPTKDMTVEMSLDFGGDQGTWSNFWNSVNSTTINRNHVEPAKIEVSTTQMEAFDNGKRYGLHMITTKEQPVLKVVSKGWHTVMLNIKPVSPETRADGYSVPDPTPGEGILHAYGINILSEIEYRMLTK